MKKFKMLLITILAAVNLFAQNPGIVAKQDVIQKVNGEEVRGKVIRITDNDVTYVYSGETVEYVIKKSEISKIIHSSGRVEHISDQALPVETRQKDEVSMSASPVDHHNKIAILPFTYLMDNQPGADAVGYKAQDDTYAYLSKHSTGYTLLDNRTTNSLLGKAGLTKETIMNFTMKEICDVLGVEYVIDGVVTQNKGYQTSFTSESSNAKVKRDGDKDVKAVSSYGSSSSNAVQRYDVTVSLHIYMDNNANIFNQSHKAFLSNTDGSYSGPLEYLLKRSPLVKK